jgi:hypothetical protein
MIRKMLIFGPPSPLPPFFPFPLSLCASALPFPLATCSLLLTVSQLILTDWLIVIFDLSIVRVKGEERTGEGEEEGEGKEHEEIPN